MTFVGHYMMTSVLLGKYKLTLLLNKFISDVGSSTSHRVSLKRGYARRDPKRIPFRFQKDRRAKFKSTEDLLHRL